MDPMTDARQLIREGRKAEALTAALATHQKTPDDPDAQLVLGIAYALVGQPAAAEPLLTKGLTGLGRAGEGRHWRLLGQIRNGLGDAFGEAVALRAATDREPGEVVNWLRLASALIDLGRRDDALVAATKALGLDDTTDARRLYVEALKGASVLDATAASLIERALEEAWAQTEVIQPVAIRLYRSGSTELLPVLLTSGPIRDATLEQELTALRRSLLEGAPASLQLRAGLAMQAFITEYAWAETPEERATLDGMLQATTPEALMTLAAYRPLGDLPGADAWLGKSLPEVARRVVQQQIVEPRRDRDAAAKVSVITAIRPGVSQAVQAQYEENPYPRWVKAPARQPQPLDRTLALLFPRTTIAPIPGAAGPEILVAGCGSGQHAVQVAARYVGARVLGVDLSRTSLAYAQRKSQDLGLTNITYAQADLLELRDRSFDVIECSGVLHHLEDPAEGMRALAGLLRPGGVLHLGLYSRLGRRLLEPARALAKGYPRTPDGIRALRQAILAAPEGDPVREAVTAGDFFSLSTCRDLLMHVQERQFDVAELQHLIGGFRFLGFALPPEVLSAYREMFPDDPAAVDLRNWAAFEAKKPDTFRGMYQFWLQKPA
jgi:2-polyprenyl-3-methyl-5-hydroxy-6-metoxy-1,4-benzoquinol methylase